MASFKLSQQTVDYIENPEKCRIGEDGEIEWLEERDIHDEIKGIEKAFLFFEVEVLIIRKDDRKMSAEDLGNAIGVILEVIVWLLVECPLLLAIVIYLLAKKRRHYSIEETTDNSEKFQKPMLYFDRSRKVMDVVIPGLSPSVSACDGERGLNVKGEKLAIDPASVALYKLFLLHPSGLVAGDILLNKELRGEFISIWKQEDTSDTKACPDNFENDNDWEKDPKGATRKIHRMIEALNNELFKKGYGYLVVRPLKKKQQGAMYFAPQCFLCGRGLTPIDLNGKPVN